MIIRILQSTEGRLAVITLAVFVTMAILVPDRFLSAANLTSMAFSFRNLPSWPWPFRLRC